MVYTITVQHYGLQKMNPRKNESTRLSRAVVLAIHRDAPASHGNARPRPGHTPHTTPAPHAMPLHTPIQVLQQPLTTPHHDTTTPPHLPCLCTPHATPRRLGRLILTPYSPWCNTWGYKHPWLLDRLLLMTQHQGRLLQMPQPLMQHLGIETPLTSWQALGDKLKPYFFGCVEHQTALPHLSPRKTSQTDHLLGQCGAAPVGGL